MPAAMLAAREVVGLASGIFKRFEADKQFRRVVAEVRAGRRLVRVAGLVGGAKALAVAALHRATGRRLAVLSVRGRDLEELERDLRFCYCELAGRDECEREVFALPASES